MNEDNLEINVQSTQDRDFSTNVLFERLVSFTRPPLFEDDVDKTRKARILNAFLIAALVISLLYAILLILTSPSPWIPIVLLASLQTAMVGGLVAMKRGNISGTATFITFFSWLFIVIHSILFGSIANPLLPSLILVIYAAGVLISSRTAIIYAMLSVVFIGVHIFLIQNELLPAIFEINVANSAVRFGITSILMAIFVYTTNRSSERTSQNLEKVEANLENTRSELSELQNYLEQTVEENTRQLERRNRYLEAAARVAQSSISTLRLQDMLEKIADEISSHLGFYHVGIFLIDDQKEWAVLRAASSQGGKQMISRGHRLAVGKQGMVGYVTSIGRARITQEIDLDRVHSETPELPDTRAEMSLPLVSRDEVIGAIDIQDTNPNAFTDEDLVVLQTMADQVALAVQNIRLYEQTQESLEEIERVYGEYSQQAWRDIYQKHLLSTVRYTGGIVSTITGESVPQVSGNKVSLPVTVRGYTIGEIELAKDEDDREWSDEELKLLQSLSDQLGIALDSARLFNESQMQATTEHLISEINSQLWETLDINTILKNTAANLRESLDLPELTIRMTSPQAEQSGNGSSEFNEQSDRDRGPND